MFGGSLLLRLVLACSVLVLTMGSAKAGTGELFEEHFEKNRTIIFAKTFECENRISGLVVKNEDWFGGLSGEGSVLLDSQVIRDFWDLEMLPEKFEAKFIAQIFHDEAFAHIKDESPEYNKLLAAAKEKDAARKKKVLAALAREHKRAGLNYDPETEMVCYFFSGEAKMRVVDSLQGSLKVDDEIFVNWKHIQRRITCPEVIPSIRECGWVLEAGLENGARTSLGHGFYSLEQGKKVKAQHDGKRELETEEEVSSKPRLDK